MVSRRSTKSKLIMETPRWVSHSSQALRQAWQAMQREGATKNSMPNISGLLRVGLRRGSGFQLLSRCGRRTLCTRGFCCAGRGGGGGGRWRRGRRGGGGGGKRGGGGG